MSILQQPEYQARGLPPRQLGFLILMLGTTVSVILALHAAGGWVSTCMLSVRSALGLWSHLLLLGLFIVGGLPYPLPIGNSVPIALATTLYGLHGVVDAEVGCVVSAMVAYYLNRWMLCDAMTSRLKRQLAWQIAEVIGTDRSTSAFCILLLVRAVLGV